MSGWLIAIGAVMAAINLSPAAAVAYEYGLALLLWPLRALLAGETVSVQPVYLAMDPTDLLTLPALLVPALILRSRGPFGSTVGSAAPGEGERAQPPHELLSKPVEIAPSGESRLG